MTDVRFSRHVLASALVFSALGAPMAHAMGDVSLPTLTFPAADVVSQDAVVLLPVPSDTDE